MDERLIFFVDDEPMFINLLEYTFKCKDGFVTKSFNKGEDCIAQLNLNPALLVVDFFLEVNRMSGLEVVKAVKAWNPAVPVIMLSGNSDADAIADAKSVGVVDYIIKDGYFIDKLVECVDQTLFGRN
ncbi:MAG: response regulator [Tannerella sp.]|nr:response regulator [Tannerella sp.]